MFSNPVSVVALVAVVIAVLYYLATRKKEKVVKTKHEYFHRLWLWPAGSHTRWEAELDLKAKGVKVPLGISAETTHTETSEQSPTDTEIAFCKTTLSNLDQLFVACKPAIQQAWNDWVKTEMPEDWSTVLKLDGFSVPKDGDMNQPWGVTYFCEPAGHFFSIQFQSGKSHLESVDG